MKSGNNLKKKRAWIPLIPLTPKRYLELTKLKKQKGFKTYSCIIDYYIKQLEIQKQIIKKLMIQNER